VGERWNPILLPMVARALEQILEWRVERIQDYCRTLLAQAADEIVALGYTIEDDKWRGSHLFGIRVPRGRDVYLVKAVLDRRHVSVSVRGSAIRVSLNVYNSASDLSALVDGLREAAEAHDA
jgi:selenocysteine lyase/cysteine desulfurase